jgi:hypothetical protein
MRLTWRVTRLLTATCPVWTPISPDMLGNLVYPRLSGVRAQCD